jgi:hypothetical protein
MKEKLLLSTKDFENVHVDPTLSVLDKFLIVARVASIKFEQQKEENKPKRKEKYHSMIPNKRPKLPQDMPTTLPKPSPDLPEEFKKRIMAMGGTQAVMVIQKALYKTDLMKNNGRLSLPFGQINKDFLKESEREDLENQNELLMQFIEPSCKFNRMMLRQWNMPKNTGNKCSIYVLKTDWNDVFKENELKIGDVVQVWSFRVGSEQKLCMALVVVSRKGKQEGGSSRGRVDGEEGHSDNKQSSKEDANTNQRGDGPSM